jgi:hypothetical protein
MGGRKSPLEIRTVSAMLGGVKLQMRQFDAARAAVFKGIASSPNL